MESPAPTTPPGCARYEESGYEVVAVALALHLRKGCKTSYPGRQDPPPNSTSLVVTVPPLRPGADWCLQ